MVSLQLATFDDSSLNLSSQALHNVHSFYVTVIHTFLYNNNNMTYRHTYMYMYLNIIKIRLLLCSMERSRGSSIL